MPDIRRTPSGIYGVAAPDRIPGGIYKITITAGSSGRSGSAEFTLTVSR